jgi:hypothetical protein
VHATIKHNAPPATRSLNATIATIRRAAWVLHRQTLNKSTEVLCIDLISSGVTRWKPNHSRVPVPPVTPKPNAMLAMPRAE